MVDDRRLAIPVGQFGGMVRGKEPGRPWFSVRRGDLVLSVEQDPGMLWLDAHGLVDELAATPWTRAAVLGRRGNLTEMAEAKAYGLLAGLKVLAEIDPQDDEAVDFARTHRLVPCAHGIGNRPDDPTQFLAGFPPDLVARFTWNQWRLWRESHLEPSLWDGCQAIAAAATRAGQNLDARDLLTETLSGLHVMLALRLAYVDVARGADDPDDEGPAADADPASDFEPLIFPVGHDLGPFFPRADEPFQYYEVCVGRQVYGIPTNEDYAVWMRAHGPVDRSPFTYTGYRNNLVADGITDAGPRARRLSDSRLLWQVPATGDRAVEFARSYRLMPLMTAIGNVGPDIPPGKYALGRPTIVFHYADELEYWLWLWAGHFDSLWHACCALSNTDLGDSDPVECLVAALPAAQSLINHSLAFLDAAWSRR